MNTEKYPEVTARPAEVTDGPLAQGCWIVSQGEGWIAIAPTEMHARIIAERLNAWFRGADRSLKRGELSAAELAYLRGER